MSHHSVYRVATESVYFDERVIFRVSLMQPAGSMDLRM